MFQKRVNSSRRQEAGFTLVELMLSVAFIGSLLMLIALIIIQIMGIYNKGLTLKEVNEVSRIVARDMQQSVTAADAFRIQYVSRDTHLPTDAQTLQEAADPDRGDGVDYYSNDAGGRLCTGTYSYVWNTGGALAKARGSVFGAPEDKYKRAATVGGPAEGYPIQFVVRTVGGMSQRVPVRFLKKSDPGKELCRIPAGDTLDAPSNVQDLPGSEKDYMNVFGAGNDELTLYSFEISTPLRPTTDVRADDITAVSTFYRVAMTLGTQNGDENSEDGLISSTQTCKPPAEAIQNKGEYCAINKLEFVARTGRIGK